MLFLALGAGGFFYLQKTKPETEPPRPRSKVWEVETIAAKRSAQAPILTLHGTVENHDLLRAAAPAAGRVSRVGARNGEVVARGDLLVEMDPQDFDLRLRQAEASVLDIEAQIEAARLKNASDRRALAEESKLLELAAGSLSRNQRLQKQNLSSDAAIDEALRELGRQQLAVNNRRYAVESHEAALKQLEGKLLSARAKLAESALAKTRSRLLAPFAGLVTRVDVSAGDRVQMNQVLAELYPLDSMEVRARIPARYQSEIQTALATGEALTASADFGNRRLALRLVRLGAEAHASGIDGYFRLEGDHSLLRLGNILQVRMRRPLQEGLQRVPYQAVYGNDRMYLLRNGRMAGIRIESVGPVADAADAPDLLVRSPELKDGDRIIITHLPNAATGLAVIER